MSAKKQQAHEKAQPPTLTLVKLDKAYKLFTTTKSASVQWVTNTSGRWEDEPTEVELDGRPSKLGLGAEISRKTKVRQSNNEATEWRLRTMLDPWRRKFSINKELLPTEKNSTLTDDEEDESESRYYAFTKN